IGVEGDAQKSAFLTAADLARDVEERVGEQHLVLQDTDPASLLDHEKASRIESRGAHVHGLHEAPDHEPRCERDAGGRRGAGAEAGSALDLAGRGAAVTTHPVAVVALLAGLEYPVAAGAGRRRIAGRWGGGPPRDHPAGAVLRKQRELGTV